MPAASQPAPARQAMFSRPHAAARDLMDNMVPKFNWSQQEMTDLGQDLVKVIKHQFFKRLLLGRAEVSTPIQYLNTCFYNMCGQFVKSLKQHLPLLTPVCVSFRAQVGLKALSTHHHS